MNASEFISPHFLEVTLDDLPTVALDLMAEFGLDELPVMDGDNYLGLFKTFGLTNNEVLPVVTDDDTYLGSIIKKELVDLITHLSSVQRDGAIIELVMRPRDYSLSQISQIVEGNNVKVLSLIVNEIEGDEMVQVILKLNSINISGVLQTFGRYNISVKRVYNFNDDTEWLSERRDALFRFINI